MQFPAGGAGNGSGDGPVLNVAGVFPGRSCWIDHFGAKSCQISMMRQPGVQADLVAADCCSGAGRIEQPMMCY